MPKTSDALTAFELLVYNWMATFIIFIVMDDKGGVGKSLIAQLITLLLREFDMRVGVVDTDFSNSTTAQVFDGTQMLDLKDRVRTGVVLNLLKRVQAGEVQHGVIDVGAREERTMTEMLPQIVSAVRRLGGRVVVIRPITLGSHNQRNAALFMDVAVELGIPTVLVRNEGQGRLPEHFSRWLSTSLRAEALAKGAVETAITDAGVQYADEAVGLSLSLVECALQDFSKLRATEDMDDAEKADLAADLADATEIFNDDVAAFLNEWLRQNMLTLGDAIEESIAKADDLAAASAAATEEPVTGKRRARKA